jgi:hypothetical protein
MGILPFKLCIISKHKPASLGSLGPGDKIIPENFSCLILSKVFYHFYILQYPHLTL